MPQHTLKPIDKGVYALIMRMDCSRHIQIGRLGKLRFTDGIYVYVGSAWGPGGLAARIGRHLKKVKQRRWHIDYFRRYATMTEIWVGRSPSAAEHLWAEAVGSFEKAVAAAEKFGSSDCRCATHLFHLPELPSVRKFNRILQRCRPEMQAAYIW